MAIYHHFDSRDDLLAAIGDRLLEPLHELELGDDWREACRRFATALRDIAVAQPADLSAARPAAPRHAGFVATRWNGWLACSSHTGSAPAQALAIYRATVSYARGYALAEATGFTVDAARPAGRRRLAAAPRGVSDPCWQGASSHARCRRRL